MATTVDPIHYPGVHPPDVTGPDDESSVPIRTAESSVPIRTSWTADK